MPVEVVYGQTLAAFIAFSYFVSIPFYFLAGKEYDKVMREAEKDDYE